ncbi:uncharacterized protein F4822DRAFT_430422 [Hypoxylon trugodes]|uniref:uncharacterized protein n=1 Tax=Hypoxylon trugodes TaxID=326681 RepID=UPI002191D29A|nr:uncharacterized protein F4822DRAFT_430422 [Hypoxylon trugodes]KAI1387677.1 hypothetical protein F4822DRAFT_430422 [Hypoxylon trugodes]
MYRAVLRAKREVVVRQSGLILAEGTALDCWEAFKYTPEEMYKQFDGAGLTADRQWKTPSAEMYLFHLKRTVA